MIPAIFRIGVGASKLALKAYRKYKSDPNVASAKEFLKEAKKIDHFHNGFIEAGKFAVKIEKQRARKKSVTAFVTSLNKFMNRVK